jgi:hypothetical protein
MNFQQFLDTTSLNKTGIFRKITVGALENQMRNIDFVETGF